MEKYSWGRDIHDAFLCSPAAADDVDTWYGEELVYIHKHRKEILAEFFKSIGITSAAKEQWDALKAKVVEFEGNLEDALSMPLK